MLKPYIKCWKENTWVGFPSMNSYLPGGTRSCLFVCSCVCVEVCVCINVCACECEGQRSMSYVFFNWSPSYFLVAGLLTGPGLLSLVILTGQWTLGIACLCSPASSPGVTVVCTDVHCCALLLWVMDGLQTQVLVFSQWQFKPSLFPAHIQNLELLNHIQTYHLQPAAMAISFPLLFIKVFQCWNFLSSV